MNLWTASNTYSVEWVEIIDFDVTLQKKSTCACPESDIHKIKNFQR